MAKSILNTTDLQGLVERLDRLSPESKALWGIMTVNQMLAHLNDTIKIALGMRDAKNKGNFVTNKIVFPLMTYVFTSWPKNLPTAPEMAQQYKGTPAKDFYTEREFLKKMMDIFTEREGSKMKEHPLFGKLTKEQWGDLLWVHYNHHLKQFGV
jgi:hypothetical protein